MTYEPFKPPAAELDPPEVFTVDRSREVPASVIAILAATRPWLRMLVGFAVAGVVLVSLSIVALAWLRPGVARPGMFAQLLLPLVVMILINGPPLLFLSRCARGIRRLESGGGLPALEDALGNQKSFWKYVGVLVLVLVPLYAMLIIGARSGFLGR